MEKGKKIIILTLLFALIAYFVLANFYKTYQAEVDVLIVPQNQKTSVMSKQVLENAAKLPLTVSFFDKLAQSDLNINNPAEGLTPAERKAYWNSRLKTKIIKGSGIIKFIAKDADFKQSEIIASGSAANDIIALSAYYNIKEDVEMRIIDGPITVSTTGYASFKVIIFSIIFGIVLAAMFSWLTYLVKNKNSQKSMPFASGTFFKDTFSIKKDGTSESKKEEEKKEEIYAIPIDENLKSKPVAEKTPEIASYEKKATAPGNLPIAETSIMSMFGATKNGTGYKMSENKPEAGQKQDKPAVYREATAEEVKERLNRLLGGI